MGVQSLDRAIGILTCLGQSGRQGMRLVDIQRAVGLKRPTAHRLLSSLIQHGLVSCDEDSRTYRLGWETALLGWSAARDGYDLREVAQASMERLIRETGVTAVLCACSGNEHVCIDRKTGDYPIKVFTVEIGIRRPVGVGAGSIAVLASMPEEQAMAALAAVKSKLSGYSAKLRQGIIPAMRAARKSGYAVSDSFVLPNVRAAGVALRDKYGIAIGSLGLAAIADYATYQRLAEFAVLLKREQARIERALRERTAARPPTGQRIRRNERSVVWAPRKLQFITH